MNAVSVEPRPLRPHSPLILAGALLCVGLVLSLARNALLGATLEWALERQGLGRSEVQVLAFDLSHIVASVRGSALGRVDRIEAEYHLGFGALPALDRVRVSGARLELAWRDGALVPALRPSASGGGSSAPLHVVLHDCVIGLDAAGTQLRVTVAGEVHAGARPTADLTYSLESAAARAHGTLKAHTLANDAMETTLTVDGGGLTLVGMTTNDLRGAAHLRIRERHIETTTADFLSPHLLAAGKDWGAARLHAARAGSEAWTVTIQSRPAVAELQATPMAGAAPWPFDFKGSLDVGLLSALLPDARAAGRLTVAATGRWPLTHGLEHGQLQGQARLDATGVQLPQVLQATELAATLDCALADAALSCQLPREAKALGLRRDRAPTPTTAPVTMLIAAAPTRPLFTMSRGATGHAVTVDTMVSLQSPRQTLRVPLALQFSMKTTADGQLGGDFALRSSVEIENAVVQARPPSTLDVAGRYSVDVEHRALGDLQLERGIIDLPAWHWTIAELRGRYRGGRVGHMMLQAGSIRSTTSPPLLIPLTAELSADVTSDQAQISGTLQDPSRRLALTLAATQQRQNGAGRASFALQPLRLSRSTLDELAPGLASGVHEARGDLSFHGDVVWGAAPLSSRFAVKLRDVTLASSTFRVDGTNLALQFDSVLPLHAPAGQTLSTALTLATLPRVPFTAAFGVADGKLHIERAQAAVFDGAFDVHDGEVDLATGATHMTLEVQDIGLESALAVLGIDDLKGSGRLSGELPFHFASGHIAVEHGYLEGRGGGVVQIGSRLLSKQAAAAQVDVQHALQALTDFRYQHLRVDVDKRLHGDGRAQLRLEGSNPAVLRDQPFVFNVSLEADFDKLAALVLHLSDASTHFFGWGTRELLQP